MRQNWGYATTSSIYISVYLWQIDKRCAKVLCVRVLQNYFLNICKSPKGIMVVFLLICSSIRAIVFLRLQGGGAAALRIY